MYVLSTAPPFILWWSNLEILFAPLYRSSPFIGGLLCQAIQTEHGPYRAERTQKAVLFCDISTVGTAISACEGRLFNSEIRNTCAGNVSRSVVKCSIF
jgi:hypothetical protein